MAENSKIEWTDHTVNFWWGCTKVSPACANCYAEAQDARFHGTAPHWGYGSPRLFRVGAAIREALRYERQAADQGRRFRVFTNSMSDFFEDRRDLELPRVEALETIQKTPHLDWIILTKRPEKILELLARAQKTLQDGWPSDNNPRLEDWLGWWISGKAPANVWLGTTVEDQERADLRIPALLQVPARVRFLSCEPLLGPVDLTQACTFPGRDHGESPFDWVICGGESGRKARPMHPDWARGLRDQCAAADVPFLFKQWGTWAPCEAPVRPEDDKEIWTGKEHPRSGIYGRLAFDGFPVQWVKRLGKDAAGRFLDGVEHNGCPLAEVLP